ncbi:lasso peptide biosynthesis B2 protein [Metabacillus sp. cB07]|uniref:lasso peptide biosynthesis B2 protein n=1 Tax=Metabacillus sp. cB07 TaxID=2806989 RepID=UPI001F5DE741|nr:lasso peptide biosynthesis B2 protein [Metabacillus sp. cB07]
MKFIPFSKIAPKLGEQMDETSYDCNDFHKKTLTNVSQAIQIMSKYTFWESQCLVKAIAAMKMLEKRKIDCTLYLGTARSESGNLSAHAWLRSGPYIVTGSEGMEKFTIVAKFAKRNGGIG